MLCDGVAPFDACWEGGTSTVAKTLGLSAASSKNTECAATSASASFLAEISIKSPQKLLSFIIKNIISASKYPKNILLKFENRSTEQEGDISGRVFILADVLVRSPRKIVIVIIKNSIRRIAYEE